MGLPAERAEKKPSRGVCHRKRDGGLGVAGQGCRRRRRHTGTCRDAAGDYVPAVCSHIGQGRTTVWVLEPDDTMVGFLHCQCCNAELGPVPPGTTPSIL